MRLWDCGTGNKIVEVKTHQREVTSVQFSPRSGMQILTNGRDSKLQILDSRTLASCRTLTHDSFRVAYSWSRAAFSPDGQYAMAGSANGTVRVWDALTGHSRSALQDHQTAVSSCAWSPGVGGWQQVASCDKNGYLCLWD